MSQPLSVGEIARAFATFFAALFALVGYILECIHSALLSRDRKRWEQQLLEDVSTPLDTKGLEKQNAELGLMPVIADEAAAYGYTAENRHFVRAFSRAEKPMLTFDDGVEVMKILMTAYMSAQSGRTLTFPPRGLDSFIPDVAQGKWKP